MRSRYAVAILLGLACVTATCAHAEPALGDVRVWTSKKGSTMQASFVKSQHGTVTLLRTDGQYATIRETALSDGDRAYIREQQEKAVQAENERAAQEALEKLGLRSGQQAVDLPEKLAGDGALAPQYLLYLPKAYVSKPRWPLVLFLHGAGEQGTEINKILKHGPPKLAKTKDFPFILVSPQCTPNKRWQSRELIKLVEHVETMLNVDPDRVYITGLSMGGYGTWHTITDYPDKFAAAVPIAGGAPANKASAVRDLPIWSFHGDNDTAVPVTEEMEMVEALRKLNKRFKFTLYEGCGHDSWTRTYTNPDMWDWLLAEKRK